MPAVMKVLLLAVMFDPATGELGKYITPLPAYETIEECHAAASRLPKELDGKTIRAYCIDPRIKFYT